MVTLLSPQSMAVPLASQVVSTAPDSLGRSDTAAIAQQHAASAQVLEKLAANLAQLETLTEGWDAGPRNTVQAVRHAVEAINAEAFRALIKSLRGDPLCAPALRSAVRDPLVYHVMLYHGLVKEPVEIRLARALDEVRPSLKEHGGDVELVALHLPNAIDVRLTGSCQTCPSSHDTLTEGVEKAVFRHCPEITEVRRVSLMAATNPNVRADGSQVVQFVSPFAKAHGLGWHEVCALEDLKLGEMALHEVAGKEILLYRQAHTVSGLANACAHMGMPLDRGEVNEGRVRCPYHGFEFLLETGECLTVPEVQLQVHAVKVVADRVHVKFKD